MLDVSYHLLQFQLTSSAQTIVHTPIYQCNLSFLLLLLSSSSSSLWIGCPVGHDLSLLNLGITSSRPIPADALPFTEKEKAACVLRQSSTLVMEEESPAEDQLSR